ncbi:hypothetical protein DPMN_141763 [Dreissena polymorpha]|uniref:C2H2-type domain-containing protein n=1 Tax=Dreissena polymorpha TaxID=45954 RepID=A0A9D4GAD6_DREPO|nr:hypothetical protein DPMN_141763 [Dreissena polymorpha]
MAPPVASDMLCQTRGEAFTHRSSLRRHLRTHAGLAIYHCCGKAFQTILNGTERHITRGQRITYVQHVEGHTQRGINWPPTKGQRTVTKKL